MPVQFVQLGPYVHGGRIQPGAKLYHYEAGMGPNAIRHIWADAAQTLELPQPFVADANGIFNFFASGDLYKIVIKDPNEVTLYTLDNWGFLPPSQSQGEDAVIPSASTITVGPGVFAHVSGNVTVTQINGTVAYYWLLADGSFSIVHSAALLCPGGLNLDVTSGDLLLVMNEGGGVWRVSQHYHAQGVLARTIDNRTNSPAYPLTVSGQTTGVPANGLGVGVLFVGENANTANYLLGALEVSLLDASLGNETTILQVSLRTNGSSATNAWVLHRQAGTVHGTLSHSNTAGRFYSFPDVDGSVVLHNASQTLTNKTLTAPVITGNTVGLNAIKTATASVSGTIVGNSGPPTIDFTMNDFSFPENTRVTATTDPTKILLVDVLTQSNVNDFLPRRRVSYTGIGTPQSISFTSQWRYFTATDNPVMWVAYDNATGDIRSVWVSDDPLQGDVPGLTIDGTTIRRMTATDLESISAINTKAGAAQALITEKKLKAQHQAYRALQLLANHDAPSQWILENLSINTNNGKLKKKGN